MASSKAQLQAILRDLERQGCRLRESKKGTVVYFTNGRDSYTVHYTTSDWRAMRNFRAAVRRAGLVWPGDDD